jgi:hypothetical protein
LLWQPFSYICIEFYFRINLKRYVRIWFTYPLYQFCSNAGSMSGCGGSVVVAKS